MISLYHVNLISCLILLYKLETIYAFAWIAGRKVISLTIKFSFNKSILNEVKSFTYFVFVEQVLIWYITLKESCEWFPEENATKLVSHNK
jgi:hypothetical protein